MSEINRDEVLKMDLKSIYAAIKNPETAAQMQNLLRDRAVVSRLSELMLEAKNREEQVDTELNRTIPPTTEELAAEANASIAAEEIPAASVAAPPAEPERKKIVREYQVRDENGVAIGRPTHLEAWSTEEMLEKMQTAHENATRAFHRLKQQKLTFKQEPKTILTPEQITEAARVALDEKSPEKVTDIIRATIESEYKKKEQELLNKEEFQRGIAVGQQFLQNHLYDYNDCEANKKAIGEYFAEKNLEFTLDNLEAAFIDLTDQSKLVKPKNFTQTTVVEAANPAAATAEAAPATPVIPAAGEAAAVPAPVANAQPAALSQPVVEAPPPTPVAAPNGQPAARRAGVNGSLPPGSLSAQRPGTPDPALARKEFLKTVKDMKPEVMKAKLKNDPQFVQQLRAYGIKVS